MPRFMLVLLTAACASNSDISVPPQIATLAIVPDVKRLGVNSRVQLTAVAEDSLGHTIVVIPVWSVFPQDVTIDQTGTVQSGTSTGSFTVNASAQGKAGTATVTVLPDLVVYEGDSNTAGAGVGANSYARQAILTLDPRVEYYNVAVDGSRISSANARAQRVDSLFDGDRSRNVLSVMLGTNDLIQAHGIVSTPASIYSALKEYWAARRARGFKIVAKTILPANILPATIFRESDRDELNTLIRSNLSLYDAIADFAADPVMGNPAAPGDTSLYQDGLHPTLYGHSLLAKLEKAALLSVLKK